MGDDWFDSDDLKMLAKWVAIVVGFFVIVGLVAYFLVSS